MRVSAAIVLVLLLAVWAGTIIGVSLIATPIKFQAPSLTTQTGAEIGRYTFRSFIQIELWFLLAAVAAAGLARTGWITWIVLVLIAIQMAVQRWWLLPVLDNRVSQILAGGSPALSIHHTAYAAIEIVKAVLLITAAALEYRSRLA